MSLPNPIFEASYKRLFGEAFGPSSGSDAFFDRFYSHFLDDPAVARLFARTDMQQQIRMLKRSLYSLTSFYVVPAANAELDRLAAIHAALGIDATMFDDWMAALLRAVAEMDPAFDITVELAWCWALAPGIAYMQQQMTTAPARTHPGSIGHRGAE